MKVIVILISASLLLALIFLGLFFTAVRKGQFDDLESPAMRMLNDKPGLTSKRKLNN
ncbi:MAG: cbb3-type cytochrome oxidase assembly protein CcoS [Bacteroidetes bacterium]|nr:cbb3-type cytochrome oxidase assembly protein CcoS [Bacteroidota bacterium]